jgi:hypothetical protein
MLLGMADQTKELQDKFAKFKGPIGTPQGGGEAKPSRPEAGKTATDADIPPSCNTGGKVPQPQKRAKQLKPGFPLPPAKVQAHANTNGIPPKAPK